MPTPSMIDLAAALEDSPQTQAAVSSLESTLTPVKDYVEQLKAACQTLQSQQVTVSKTMTSFSNILLSFPQQMQEENGFMSAALKRLAKHITEMQSWQEMLCTQLSHAVVEQFDCFLNKDFTHLDNLKLLHDQSRTDHEQAILKFSKVSKKKETDRSRFEANAELFTARKSFLQKSLQYYSELNNFQLKKKFQVLDPLLAFMHAQLNYFKMGHESFTDEVGRFISNLNVGIQKARSEYDISAKQQKKSFMTLDQQAATLCIADPDPQDPFVDYPPSNLLLQSKSGYLWQKQFGNKWERNYLYTEGHRLYSHTPQKSPVLVTNLSSPHVTAGPADMDDKRYLFQITHDPLKKPVVFQAECPKIRDEWIAVVGNISKHPKAKPLNLATEEKRTRSDSDDVRMQRARISSWVEQEVTPTSPPKRTLTSRLPPPDVPPPRPPPPGAQQPKGTRRRYSERAAPSGHSTLGSSSVQQLLERAETTGQYPTKSGYVQNFEVNYLGSMEVASNKGIGVVTDTIRKIIAARALKNIMKKVSVKMFITHKAIRLVDHTTKTVTVHFKLKDVSYCAKHPENHKLFAIISRSWQEGVCKHTCHVFETGPEVMDGLCIAQICQAVIEAIRTAVKLVTDQQQTSPTAATPTTTPTSLSETAEVTDGADKSRLTKSLSTGSFKDSSTPQRGRQDSFEEARADLINLMETPEQPRRSTAPPPSPTCGNPSSPDGYILSSSLSLKLQSSLSSPPDAPTSIPDPSSTSPFSPSSTADLELFDPLTNTHSTLPSSAADDEGTSNVDKDNTT